MNLQKKLYNCNFDPFHVIMQNIYNVLHNCDLSLRPVEQIAYFKDL